MRLLRMLCDGSERLHDWHQRSLRPISLRPRKRALAIVNKGITKGSGNVFRDLGFSEKRSVCLVQGKIVFLVPLQTGE